MEPHTAQAAISPDARSSAWRFVTAFGIISLLADLVYEGALAGALYDRSITALIPTVAFIQGLALVVLLALHAGARRHHT